MTGGAKVLKYIASGLMALFAVVGGLFIIGETLTDPGGVTGVVVSASWVVPMLALAIYALRRPQTATTVLTVLAALAAAFVVLDVVFGIVPLDEMGPVGSVTVFAVAVALGFLGVHRPAPAGWLLLLVGAANLTGVFAKMLERDGAPPGAALGGSSGAVAVPVLVIGALFLLAASLEARPSSAEPGGRDQSRHLHSAR